MKKYEPYVEELSVCMAEAMRPEFIRALTVVFTAPNGVVTERRLTGRVGCVYPSDEGSYFITSNLGSCCPITCNDGYFFAEMQ